LFANADIIAATLNSTMNGQMENFFVRKTMRSGSAWTSRPFKICIVDEASQCVEPEALIPLKLGFTKLVMVGDPAQLPATVSSLEAKQQSYSVSLFSRYK
jgi:superfamily I DNA and/or RNA helicase